MLDSSSFIQIALKVINDQEFIKEFENLPEELKSEKMDFYREDMWEIHYGFPLITLIVGDEQQTKELIAKLVEHVNNRKLDVEFRTISMVELIENNNRPLNSPKGQDGGYLILKYQEGLTEKNLYELTKHILMNKNIEEFSVYNGLGVDQNWREESLHRKNNDIMPWIRTGWNLIVVADSQYHYMY